MFANSNLMNRINTTSHTVWNMTWWRAMYIAGIVVSSVLTAAAAGVYLYCELSKNKGGEKL